MNHESDPHTHSLPTLTLRSTLVTPGHNEPPTTYRVQLGQGTTGSQLLSNVYAYLTPQV